MREVDGRSIGRGSEQRGRKKGNGRGIRGSYDRGRWCNLNRGRVVGREMGGESEEVMIGGVGSAT